MPLCPYYAASATQLERLLRRHYAIAVDDFADAAIRIDTLLCLLRRITRPPAMLVADMPRLVPKEC